MNFEIPPLNAFLFCVISYSVLYMLVPLSGVLTMLTLFVQFFLVMSAIDNNLFKVIFGDLIQKTVKIQ